MQNNDKQPKGNYLSSGYIKISNVNLTNDDQGKVVIPVINGYQLIAGYPCSGEWVYMNIYNLHSWWHEGQLYYLKTSQPYAEAATFEYMLYYIKI